MSFWRAEPPFEIKIYSSFEKAKTDMMTNTIMSDVKDCTSTDQVDNYWYGETENHWGSITPYNII